jgi:hypothetical protein
LAVKPGTVVGILITADAGEKVKDKLTFAEKRYVRVKEYRETIEAYVVGQVSQELSIAYSVFLT